MAPPHGVLPFFPPPFLPSVPVCAQGPPMAAELPTMAPLSLLPPTWSFRWRPLLSPFPWQPSPAMAEFPGSTPTPYSPPWPALELHSSPWRPPPWRSLPAGEQPAHLFFLPGLHSKAARSSAPPLPWTSPSLPWRDAVLLQPVPPSPTRPPPSLRSPWPSGPAQRSPHGSTAQSSFSGSELEQWPTVAHGRPPWRSRPSPFFSPARSPLCSSSHSPATSSSPSSMVFLRTSLSMAANPCALLCAAPLFPYSFSLERSSYARPLPWRLHLPARPLTHGAGHSPLTEPPATSMDAPVFFFTLQQTAFLPCAL